MFDPKKTTISFDYDSPENDEILRNLTLLYSTPAGTVPMDRSFGIDQEFLGYPVDVAKNMLALEYIEKTEIYEPRAYIKDITFKIGTDGSMQPEIKIKRRI